MMRILLLSKNGRVGWELQRALGPLGDVRALDCNNGGDLTDPACIQQQILENRPNVVVNAAAYTAVDMTESEQELVSLVNHKAVEAMADSCKPILVPYSTDYVFSGEGNQPWSENDSEQPANEYGQSKLKGKQAIAVCGCMYLIFRTSWVDAAKGNSFVKTMLKLAASRTDLNVINGQFDPPTSAELISDVSTQAIPSTLSNSEKSGLYYLVASGETTLCEYAKYVFDAKQYGCELRVEIVNGITASQYPAPAKRPFNSRLNCSKLEKTLFCLCLIGSLVWIGCWLKYWEVKN